jgi:hypothetical protein
MAMRIVPNTKMAIITDMLAVETITVKRATSWGIPLKIKYLPSKTIAEMMEIAMTSNETPIVAYDMRTTPSL